jgi:hypothetical protein
LAHHHCIKNPRTSQINWQKVAYVLFCDTTTIDGCT